MFDLRYHVASLAAVFLALVIGILVGVGIADRGVREDALRENLAQVNSDLDKANGTADFLERQQKATQDFVEASYPALMSRRLDGKRVALVFVGSVDDDVRSSVGKTISDANGRLSIVRALKLPVDRRTMQSALARRSLVGNYAGVDGMGDLGRDLAAELVKGGDTPLWNAVGSDLVEEQSGKLRPVDAIVVARTASPQHGATGRFLNGFYAALGDAKMPAVGVESSDVKTTAVGVFREQGLSTVDDLEKPTGRLALALLLAGGPGGQYGLREADDALMPPIDPLPASG
jgi:Copper transport outer membrane protein, MctB